MACFLPWKSVNSVTSKVRKGGSYVLQDLALWKSSLPFSYIYIAELWDASWFCIWMLLLVVPKLLWWWQPGYVFWLLHAGNLNINTEGSYGMLHQDLQYEGVPLSCIAIHLIFNPSVFFLSLTFSYLKCLMSLALLFTILCQTKYFWLHHKM